MHGVLRDVIAEIIGCSELHTAFDSAAGEQDCEAAAVMIAACARIIEAALAVGGSSEFGCEDHECVFEHAAHFEIFDHCRAGLIDISALIGKLSRERDVLIPTAMEELHEAHAAFEESTREQAIRGVTSWRARIRTIVVECRLRLICSVSKFRH